LFTVPLGSEVSPISRGGSSATDKLPRLPPRGAALKEKRKKEEYVKRIRAECPAEHIQVANEVYGPDWGKPYTSIFVKGNK